MDVLTIERAQRLYRSAIDARATDAEGVNWWEEVRAELERVLAARSVREAATVIAWWHADWSFVGDSPMDAARRIRAAAKSN